MRKIRRKIFFIFALFLPIVVRIGSYQLERIHGDEFITAYFSSHYDLLKSNFFAPVPNDSGEWIIQTASLYYLIQKIFFIILGENLFTVKLSIIPYVLIISIFTYYLSQLIFDEKTAFISLILYSFFSISLYFETLGLQHTSNTAIFIITTYLLFIVLRKRNIFIDIMIGIFGAMNYLFFPPGYLAIFVILGFMIYELVTKKNLKLLKDYGISFLFFILVLLPFFIYMVISKNFYLFSRLRQVSLLTGSWSSVANAKLFDPITPKILINNAFLSFKSFYKDGIGGDQGFIFGHQAFFDKTSLVIFILGILSGLFLKKTKENILLIIFIIFMAFFLGMVLTMPPPSYQRFIIVVPFLILTMSSIFYFILNTKKIKPELKYLLIGLTLLIYIFSNYKYYKKASYKDLDKSVILGKYIEKNYPKNKIYIGAFPNYHLKKVFYFFSKKNFKNVIISQPEELLKNINSKEKYVYIILYPEQSLKERFQKVDKNGKMVDFSSEISLFAN